MLISTFVDGFDHIKKDSIEMVIHGNIKTFPFVYSLIFLNLYIVSNRKVRGSVLDTN